MKIYAIHKDADNWHPTTRFFHTVMFHGEAVLPPGRHGAASHDPGEPQMSPMRLVVNSFRLAEVICPERSCNLVVSERVMHRLEPLRANFLFVPVAFAKVFTLPWSPGGGEELPPRYEKLRRAGREMSILAACPHDPQAAAALPAFFEVVAPNHYELLKRYPATHRFFTKCYEGDPIEDDRLPVSRPLFEAYPITSPGYTVVRDDIFDALSPYLDQTHFGIKEYSLGPA